MKPHIAPGALCTCRQTGTVLWIVVAQADVGQHWRLRGKRVDHRGRSDMLTVGDVIREAESNARRAYEKEPPERSRIRFATITEQEDLRQRGLV
jgi:hypothetical protein